MPMEHAGAPGGHHFLMGQVVGEIWGGLLSRSKCHKADGINRRQCVQRRLAFSVGVNPTGARVRSPVAWIARVEETKHVKPIDKAIFGMVSESPGHNASEPTGGPDNLIILEAECSLFA